MALEKVYRYYVDEVSIIVRRGFFLKAQRPTRVPGVYHPESEREVVQEVFLRAFSEKARMNYDGLRPYRPYLLQIVKNLMVDYWRKQGREVFFENGRGDWTQDISLETKAFSSPEEELQWRSWQAATEQYLGGLDDHLREFVRLRFEEGYSQYDLVQKLNLSRWRVRSLEKKVQENLRKYLKSKQML